MISILVVDDNHDKLARIVSVLTRIPGISSHHIDSCEDLVGARDCLVKRRYDLLILDLRVPNRAGDHADDCAGGDFLREITVSRTLLKPFHVIGLTAYEEALQKADPVFLEELWRVIRFDAASIDWESRVLGCFKAGAARLLIRRPPCRHCYSNRTPNAGARSRVGFTCKLG